MYPKKHDYALRKRLEREKSERLEFEIKSNQIIQDNYCFLKQNSKRFVMKLISVLNKDRII